MYRYKYDKSYHHKSRRASRVSHFAIFISIIVIGVFSYIAYDIFKESNKSTSVVSAETHSVIKGATANVFRTEYFQFQASDAWKEIPTETKGTHYVYRSFKKDLIDKDIIIDVNKTTPDVIPLMRNTYVMPVTVDASGRFVVTQDAGDKCDKTFPKDDPDNPRVVTQKQVSFVCTPDASIYQVAVGIIGGDTAMKLSRPNGTKATYAITYRDYTVTPSDAQLRGILQTFQTR